MITFVQQSLKTKLIVENVKIGKIIFIKHTFKRSAYSWSKNATIIVKRIEESFYVCIAHLRKIKKQGSMNIVTKGLTKHLI
jgi:hypothetical protein